MTEKITTWHNANVETFTDNQGSLVGAGLARTSQRNGDVPKPAAISYVVTDAASKRIGTQADMGGRGG